MQTPSYNDHSIENGRVCGLREIAERIEISYSEWNNCLKTPNCLVDILEKATKNLDLYYHLHIVMSPKMIRLFEKSSFFVFTCPIFPNNWERPLKLGIFDHRYNVYTCNDFPNNEILLFGERITTTKSVLLKIEEIKENF